MRIESLREEDGLLPPKTVVAPITVGIKIQAKRKAEQEGEGGSSNKKVDSSSSSSSSSQFAAISGRIELVDLTESQETLADSQATLDLSGLDHDSAVLIRDLREEDRLRKGTDKGSLLLSRLLQEQELALQQQMAEEITAEDKGLEPDKLCELRDSLPEFLAANAIGLKIEAIAENPFIG
ncbi:hypothetical protein B484DRAFT_459608 [Ochromonadaceae sp. CCMP2298]|nr:hypothetical protein B484DRAFT_459608 [Ochromonadaceae sp. CCMP2298]